jgi:ABC-2 type transport system ATP-binding protein
MDLAPRPPAPSDPPQRRTERGERGAHPPGIRVRGLTRRFGALQALSAFDLDIPRGAVTGLLGPNGSGKSTLLRCLVGLVRPDAGTAEVDGVPLLGDGTAIRRRCTYSPGEVALYGELSGREHLRWFLRGRDRPALRRALAMADELGLPLAKRVRGYSHGMKRQLLFAAAMAPDVPVRILDEASEGLDPTKRGQILGMLEADARRGVAILLSSHHLGEVDRVCDRLVFLNAGRLVGAEDAAGVRERAGRLLRIDYGDTLAAQRAAQALAHLAGSVARVRDGALTVELERPDPRAALAALCAAPELARPRTVEYGRLSLAELYRELYGVEGC